MDLVTVMWSWLIHWMVGGFYPQTRWCLPGFFFFNSEQWSFDWVLSVGCRRRDEWVYKGLTCGWYSPYLPLKNIVGTSQPWICRHQSISSGSCVRRKDNSAFSESSPRLHSTLGSGISLTPPNSLFSWSYRTPHDFLSGSGMLCIGVSWCRTQLEGKHYSRPHCSIVTIGIPWLSLPGSF